MLNSSRGAALVGPALLFVFLLAIYPMAQVLLLSLQSGGLSGGPSAFTGLTNYLRLIHDPTFWGAFQHTLLYVIGSTALHILLGTLLALLLFNLRATRGIRVLQTLLILPWAVTPSIAAALWRLVYHPELSLIPKFLSSVGIRIAWNLLGDTRFALLAVLLVNVWLFTPFYMLMVLARLQATPLELFDAASVDGATWNQTVLHILLPSLRSLLFTLMAFDVTGTFVQFDVVWVMTGGGPLGSTELLSTYIYRSAFTTFDFGIAAAAGIFLLIALGLSSRALLSKAEGSIV